ncbi:MAG: 4-hydroxy-tetrahydrodipicolinate synthase [Alphaproteobacteria bacterium]|jgi:4-hydroxy-tetrahydrodipicolinate synthase|nr:4-hydroxy-tetrahydrodipicolinate synthase [Alphaproteobacteria bacterium]MDP6516283.1 4-hydroxy-tetrahydrodipicolinate synthase [Alphaproteobacteria bacterium]
MFTGSFTALITPFRDGAVDKSAFQDFVEWQIGQGVHGLVACGTTGESPTLSHDEHESVIELCIEAAAGRVPVIAGTGSNSAAEAISLTRHAAEAGADAALVVMPYYNKPTPEGQYRHFKTIAESADIPIIIYNIPGRCVVDMSVETMARLAEVPNIIGVKDATGDAARPSDVRRAIGHEFCQMSGEDGCVPAMLAHGGHGCISVTANVAPAVCAAMHEAWQAGDSAKTLEIHDQLTPLNKALFLETSPGPVKYAASLLGLCAADLRLPMCEIAGSTKEKVHAAMEAVGILTMDEGQWRAAT